MGREDLSIDINNDMEMKVYELVYCVQVMPCKYNADHVEAVPAPFLSGH